MTTKGGVQEQGLLLKVSISKGLTSLIDLPKQDAESAAAIQNEEASQRPSRTKTTNAQAREPAKERSVSKSRLRPMRTQAQTPNTRSGNRWLIL